MCVSSFFSLYLHPSQPIQKASGRRKNYVKQDVPLNLVNASTSKGVGMVFACFCCYSCSACVSVHLFLLVLARWLTVEAKADKWYKLNSARAIVFGRGGLSAVGRP